MLGVEKERKERGRFSPPRFGGIFVLNWDLHIASL
jgi:hypothetical protein